MYLAKRTTSKYCSEKCRKQANRDIDDDISVPSVTLNAAPVTLFHAAHYKTKNNKNLCNECTYELDINNEWSHSACYKTQDEIEAHYTLENFPNITYHSSGGGGTGTIAPPKPTKRQYG